MDHQPAEEARHELSNTMAGVLLAHLRQVAGPRLVDEVLNRAGETRSLEEISDSANWSSFESIRDLFEAAVEVTGDPTVPRKAGADIFRHYSSDAVTSLMRSLGEPEAVLRLIADFAGKQTTLSAFECVDSGSTHAVIEVHRISAVPAQRIWCDYTAGVFSAVPDIFGLPFAGIEEVQCQTRGDGVCRFEVTWRQELADPASEADAMAERMASLTSRFGALEAMATELASVDDVDTALETITHRAAIAVRAPHYLLAVRLPRDEQVRVHRVGLTEAEARTLATEILAEHPDDRDGTRLIVDVASSVHRFGRLVAVNPGVSRFAPEERRLLQAYAGHAAAALQTAAALAESRARVHALQALLDLSGALADAQSTGEAADRLAISVPKVLDCEEAVVLTWDPEGEMLSCRGHSARSLDGTETSLAHLPATTARRLAATGHPVVLDEVRAPGGLRTLAGMVGFDGGVLMSIAARGELLGLLVVRTGEELGRGGGLLAQLPGVASLAATALDNVALLEQVRHQALHDPLTGLPNLRILQEQPGLARRSWCRHAVLFVDLDGFKQVNDELGHACGDELLVQVAARLQRDIRAGDTVVRIGGDEFAVLLGVVVDAAEAEAIAGRLLGQLEPPFDVGGRTLTVSASIGVAVGDGGDTVEQLLARSDAAMYEAKRAGRATVRTAAATVG